MDAEKLVKDVERGIVFAQSLDPRKQEKLDETAAAAVAALEAAGDAKAVTLRQRLETVRAKVDEIMTGRIASELQTIRSAAAREHTSFAQAREKGNTPMANNAIQKIRDASKKAKDKLEAARADLGGVKGRALVADTEKWIVENEAPLAGNSLVAEVSALLNEKGVDVPGLTGLKLEPALSSVENNLKTGDFEKVLASWQGAKQLIVPLLDPKFSGVAEAAKVVDKYRQLEVRVAAELPKLITARTTAPLVAGAKEFVGLINRAVDSRDEAEAIRWSKELRARLHPLVRDWKAVADATDAHALLAASEQAFARAETELGERVALQQIADIEKRVLPLIERLEAAHMKKAAAAVIDHAPRLRTRLADLAPFSTKPPARELLSRGEAALARVQELGADVALAVAEAETYPRFQIDHATDAFAQIVLRTIRTTVEQIEDEFLKAQARFDDRVHLANGAGSGITQPILSDIDSATRWCIAAAGRLEQHAAELTKRVPDHPVAREVLAYAPKLVKRMQTWKDRMTQKCAYAHAIEAAYLNYKAAVFARDSGTDGFAQALDRVDAAVANAMTLLPDDHFAADAWRAKAAELRV